jgi:hypothetical protein
MFLPQKFSLKFKTWACTFIASFLLVGIYVCYSISIRPYPNDAIRYSDMTTCFFYGGFIGGWLGVLGLWFTLASWQCLSEICCLPQNTRKEIGS